MRIQGVLHELLSCRQHSDVLFHSWLTHPIGINLFSHWTLLQKRSVPMTFKGFPQSGQNLGVPCFRYGLSSPPYMTRVNVHAKEPGSAARGHRKRTPQELQSIFVCLLFTTPPGYPHDPPGQNPRCSFRTDQAQAATHDIAAATTWTLCRLRPRGFSECEG